MVGKGRWGMKKEASWEEDETFCLVTLSPPNSLLSNRFSGCILVRRSVTGFDKSLACIYETERAEGSGPFSCIP